MQNTEEGDIRRVKHKRRRGEHKIDLQIRLVRACKCPSRNEEAKASAAAGAVVVERNGDASHKGSALVEDAVRGGRASAAKVAVGIRGGADS